MNNNYETAKEILEKYKQDHIIEFIDKLNLENRDKIVNQVLRIDFEELAKLYKKTFEDIFVDLEELQPIAGVKPEELSSDELESIKETGIDIIKSNKFAVITMAGGEGTRLRTFRP